MSEANEAKRQTMDFREFIVLLIIGLVIGFVFRLQFGVHEYSLAFILSFPVVLFAVNRGFRHGALAAVVAAAIYGSYLLLGHFFGNPITRSRLWEEQLNLGIIIGSGFIPGIITEFLQFRKHDPFKEEATIVETFVPDEETGLYNFKSFRWMLRGEMKRVKRYNTPMSLIFIKLLNLDNFRKRYDYQQEVLLLKEVGHHLRSMLREADYVGKYSDNEVGIVLPETGLAGVNIVCNRLVEKHGKLMGMLNKSWDEIELEFEFSRANYPKDASNLEELIDILDSRYERLG